MGRRRTTQYQQDFFLNMGGCRPPPYLTGRKQEEQVTQSLTLLLYRDQNVRHGLGRVYCRNKRRAVRRRLTGGLRLDNAQSQNYRPATRSHWTRLPRTPPASSSDEAEPGEEFAGVHEKWQSRGKRRSPARRLRDNLSNRAAGGKSRLITIW